MGLTAQLEGVMNGTFLIAVGAIWTEIKLSPKLKTIAYWSLLYGAYANWVVTLFATIFGTNALPPITSAGHQGQPWQEIFVMISYTSVGIIMVTAAILLLLGLRRTTL